MAEEDFTYNRKEDITVTNYRKYNRKLKLHIKYTHINIYTYILIAWHTVTKHILAQNMQVGKIKTETYRHIHLFTYKWHVSV